VLGELLGGVAAVGHRLRCEVVLRFDRVFSRPTFRPGFQPTDILTGFSAEIAIGLVLFVPRHQRLRCEVVLLSG